MHELSDNKYLKKITTDKLDGSANSFLFREFAVQREVNIEVLYKSVLTLLSRLGFTLHYSGYTFLAKLVQIYLVDDNYNYSDAVTRVAYLYGTEVKRVLANIRSSVEINNFFISRASSFLGMRVSQSDTEDIPSVVEMIGAIFTLFYNYVVVGDTETEADKHPLRDISKIFASENKDGQQ